MGLRCRRLILTSVPTTPRARLSWTRLPLPAPLHRLVPVLDNIPIARDTYRLRLGDAAMAGRSSPVSS